MSDLKKVEAARDKLLATARTVIVTTALPEEEGGLISGFRLSIVTMKVIYIYTSHLSAHVSEHCFRMPR